MEKLSTVWDIVEFTSEALEETPVRLNRPFSQKNYEVSKNLEDLIWDFFSYE